MYQKAGSGPSNGTFMRRAPGCVSAGAQLWPGARSRSRQSLKVCTVGVPEFQVAISEETSEPSLKSTRSQPAADHVCTENPAAGLAATSCTDVAATSNVT
jgi:hypothetical protein